MDQNQTVLKCPFRNTLITKDYGCENAREATHRDGPGVICDQTEAHNRCVVLFEALKTATLPALNIPDDLTQMPASVIGKIQYGGLAALSEMLAQNHSSIDNINALIEAASNKYQNIKDFDFEKIVPVIINYKLQRRRNR